MRYPAKIDLVADRRLAFADSIARVGIDFTGADFSAEVRLVPDADGTPLATMAVTLTYGGSDTIANHITATRLTDDIYEFENPDTGVDYAPTDVVPLSVIDMAISDTDMAELPAAPEAGDEEHLAWDMLITPFGGVEDKWFYGEFRVRGTVTV